MKLVTQSATILASLLLVLVIISTSLADYMAPIIGLVVAFSVIYIVIKQRTNRGQDVFTGSNKEVFAVTLALLLAIFLTGGLSSNLYFLLYFLIFGIVFLFEPLTIFVLLAGLIVVFLPSVQDGDLASNIIKLGSLAFLSPIAFFFGREFQKREHLERQIEDKTGQIIEDAQTLIAKDPDLPEEDIDEINDIIERANQLRGQSKKDN